MKAPDFVSLSNEQLAQQFAELSLQEFDAELGSNTKAVIRLARARIAISSTLKARTPDGRIALVPLLDHKNPQVRLNAAESLAGLDRDRAVATLRDLHRSAPSAQRGAAGVALHLIEKGIATLD